VRLSRLGTAATNWPIVPAPDDRWWWLWSSWWNEDRRGIPKYSEKTCPSVTLSNTNPTWPDLGSNPNLRGGKPATNHLSYGAAVQNKIRWLKRQGIWRLFWRFAVQIQPNSDYRDWGFPWFFSVSKVHSGIPPEMRLKQLPSTSFPLHYSLIIIPFDILLSELLMTSSR
jgi:hypothetical protein